MKILRRILDTVALFLFVALWPVVAMAQVTKITPASGASGVTIGTTAITGGATTEVLYNAAGVVSSDAGFTRSGLNGTTTISNGTGAVSPLVVKDNVTSVFEVLDGGLLEVVAGTTAIPSIKVTGTTGGIWFSNGLPQLNQTANAWACGVNNGVINEAWTCRATGAIGFSSLDTLSSPDTYFQRASAGFFKYPQRALTAATATASNTAELRTFTHAYSWTNAMVVALGGASGDLGMVTLPAKTQVNNAYVVIDTAATQAATLTVSCGDAVGGTPFINWIVASDAKAAANTVYGDAVGERGTSIDTEFYYLPSYTATTLVTCHFIIGAGTLADVTAFTGHLVLTTTLVP